MTGRAGLALLVVAGMGLLDGGVAFGQGCPELVGQWETRETRAVAVSGDIACFGGGRPYPSTERWLLVANVSNPSLPTVVGELALPGKGEMDIAVAEPHLCVVANGDAGVRVVDVSTPSAPVEVGFYDALGHAEAVAVAASNAFVADSSDGLRVIAFGGDEPPHEIGFWSGSPAYDVALGGSHAYVAASSNGLRVLDISNPSAPTEVGSYAVRTFAVAVEGSYAYVLASYPKGSSLRIIDVSNPTAPVQVGVFSAADIRCVTVAGKRVYLGRTNDCASGILEVIDVSIPSRPHRIGSGWTDFCCGPVDVAVANGAAVGNQVYMASNAGLQVFDVSTPSTPTVVGSIATNGSVNGVALSGHYAFVAQGPVSMVYDVSDPAAPLPLVSLGHWARAIALRDGYAYLGSTDTTGGTLHIVDVSSPRMPTEVGLYAFPWYPSYVVYSIDVEGSLAFVATGDQGLRILDVTTPSAPVEIGSYATHEAFRVAVAGSLAYVTSDDSGLRVVDVSIPSAPVEIGSFETPGGFGGVAVASPYAYVDGSEAFHVVDVSSPSAPFEVGSWGHPSGGSIDIKLAGSHAYLSYAGLKVLDVSNPSAPYLVATYPDTVFEVVVANRYVYAALGSGLGVLTRCGISSRGSTLR